MDNSEMKACRCVSSSLLSLYIIYSLINNDVNEKDQALKSKRKKVKQPSICLKWDLVRILRVRSHNSRKRIIVLLVTRNLSDGLGWDDNKTHRGGTWGDSRPVTFCTFWGETSLGLSLTSAAHTHSANTWIEDTIRKW